MEIFLVDLNPKICEMWEICFKEDSNIHVYNMSLNVFLNEYDVDAIATPANSYGIMTGGFDGALIDYFGDELMEKVQEKILKDYSGEQSVGTAFIIDIPKSKIKLIHVPTMRIPPSSVSSETVYQCMRETLLIAKKNNINRVLIPAFGGATGRTSSTIIATKMKQAYDQINNPPDKLDRDYAFRKMFKL